MYCLSEEQIAFIRNDISRNGIETEDLQSNLLDHICCIIEQNLEENGDFGSFYSATLKTFYKKELREIEEETKSLLLFKNYYAMKKVMIVSGTFSAIGFIVGSFFKFMHWPGANILIVLSIFTLAALFLPLLSILKIKEVNANRDKLVIGSGTLVGILYCTAVLFTIQHWPGSRTGVFWIITTATSMFIFIPIYFFNGIRKPETKVNTIVSSILLVVVTGLHFTMVSLRPTSPEIKMYSYIQNERLLQQMQKVTNNPTREISERNKLAAVIQNTCAEIKGLILRQDIGQKTLPDDFEAKSIIINEHSAGNDFFNNGRGVKLMAQLKEEITKYNGLKENDHDGLIPVRHSILSVEPDRLSSYTNLFILNGITQLQMYLVNAEHSLLASK